mmetsp:Transcript_16028/g.54055  ORF Transcript_16028/g.54055 Transcript_16028/m.54055 type:complete len:274 (+) Transcript_16028:1089-1910(+)
MAGSAKTCESESTMTTSSSDVAKSASGLHMKPRVATHSSSRVRRRMLVKSKTLTPVADVSIEAISAASSSATCQTSIGSSDPVARMRSTARTASSKMRGAAHMTMPALLCASKFAYLPSRTNAGVLPAADAPPAHVAAGAASVPDGTTSASSTRVSRVNLAPHKPFSRDASSRTRGVPSLARQAAVAASMAASPRSSCVEMAWTFSSKQARVTLATISSADCAPESSAPTSQRRSSATVSWKASGLRASRQTARYSGRGARSSWMATMVRSVA